MQVDGDNDEDRIRHTVDRLRNNNIKTFSFYIYNNDRPWTLVHARDLLSALMDNTSVVTMYIMLQYCPLPAIPLLLQYIQSNPRLESVRFDYSPMNGDNAAIQDKYKRHIGDILEAISQKPSIIKKLEIRNDLGSKPQAVFNLLSESTTLESFDLDIFDGVVTPQMARAVAGGFARSHPSLQKVSVWMPSDNLGIVLSGIGPSSIKSLTVDLNRPTFQGYSAIANVLAISRSLKKLTVRNEYGGQAGQLDGVEQLFYALQEPGCAPLEEMALHNVRLDSLAAQEVAVGGGNSTLQVLVLKYSYWYEKGSVRNLCFLVGLKELRVECPDPDDDYLDSPFPLPEGFGSLIQCNPDLLTLSVGHIWWNDCAEGLLQGACGHESLEVLDLSFEGFPYHALDQDFGSRLCQLIQQTKSLKTLGLDGLDISREGAVLLVEGICKSKNLQHLIVKFCHISFQVLTLIVECFLFNQTVKKFEFGCYIEGSENDYQTFCHTLSHVLRVNTALESFQLPAMDINEENGLMNVLVDDGLVHNKVVTTLDFSACTLDHTALTCLGNALLVESSNASSLSLSSVRLPSLDMVEGVKPFLRNLPRMPNIKEVAYQGSLDLEGKKLLLQAAKEKKTLLSFEYLTSNFSTNERTIHAETEFYLKLNRFGRRIVELSNAVPSSCWPIILSRMTAAAATATMTTSDPPAGSEHVDALFYFVCKYFAKQHDEATKQDEEA